MTERNQYGRAEELFRNAVATGNTDAMVNLGNVLVSPGATKEAEHWYRCAVTAGHPVRSTTSKPYSPGPSSVLHRPVPQPRKPRERVTGTV